MILEDSVSISQLKFLAKGDKTTSLFLEQLLCTSYDEFLNTLYKNLEECIEWMEEDPKVRLKDGEDRLTTDIIGFFRARGYQAGHDELIGGHTDLVIRKEGYMWLGEAKIHSSYDYLKQGFEQLCSRYSSGTNNNKNGGLLIYIRNNDAASVITEWTQRLNDAALENYSYSPCGKRQGLSFYSTHKHARSGLPYRVRHLGIVLGFDPQDKN
ncbi:hypothetical protein [Serratia plymuthica]|uniref:hypothetical protein n=1 Tax=Serratia plymuthica TaxID=82996 RepID=UPI0007EBE79A|nr:hypothetical protein [Serratia plymuthica]ANJ93398.1 hypothetical protein ADP72_10580 [Serratia plymuthica]